MNDQPENSGGEQNSNSGRPEDGPAPWEIGATSWEPPRQSAPPPPARIISTVSYSVSSENVAVGTGYDLRDTAGVGRKIAVALSMVAAVLFMWLLFYELVPADIPAATTFATYISPDKRFLMQTPTDWSVQSDPAASDGDNDPSGRTQIRQGPVKVIVTTDTVTDLKANALVQSGAALPEEFTESPSKALYSLDKPATSASFKGYAEQQYTSMDTNFGPAYVSEFTGRGGMFGWGGPIHGYRLAVADSIHTYAAVFVCPAKSWSNLQPTFQHMIATIGPADGSRYTPETDDSGSSRNSTPSYGSGESNDNSADQNSGNDNGGDSAGAAGYGGGPADGADGQ